MDHTVDGSTDELDDIAAFLMHRTTDPELTTADRLTTFALVAAYREGDAPAEIAAALRSAATEYFEHPDFQTRWGCP